MTQDFALATDIYHDFNRFGGLNSAFSNCSFPRFRPNESANSNMAEFVRALSAVLARLDKTYSVFQGEYHARSTIIGQAIAAL
jgi:hypothetical protein